MRVRPATPDDFQAIAALDRVAWEEHRFGDYIPDGEHVWRIWVEYSLVYCATEEDRVVGAILAFPCTDGRYCLHKVFVERSSRRRGVGSALFLALLAETDRRALELFLTVDPLNEPAQALYRRWGFVRERLAPGFYRAHEDRLILVRRPVAGELSGEQ